MYKKLFIIFIMAITFISSCKKNREPVSMVPENYKNWLITADNLNYPIPGHENHFRRIFVNNKGKEAEVVEKNGRIFYDYPKGTIVIKEIYPDLNPGDNTEPVSLTVMIKDPDNPKARGGWLWIVKDLKTKDEKIIDYEFCFDCHTNANEPHQYGDRNPDGEFRDYLFFPVRK